MSMKHRLLFRRRKRTFNTRRHAEMFGDLIRGIRLSDRRPLEQIARQAALTTSEWEAMEAGQVPRNYEELLLIVRALHLGRSWMPHLVKMCDRAHQN